MNTFGLALASILVAAATMPAEAGVGRLDMLKGKARPLVVLSDSRDDPRVARQISAIDHTRAAVTERDIRVLEETRPGGPLRRRLGVARRGFAVVLVGKDGGVKKVWHDPVDPKAIFTIIDRMPMRREEMKG